MTTDKDFSEDCEDCNGVQTILYRQESPAVARRSHDVAI